MKAANTYSDLQALAGVSLTTPEAMCSDPNSCTAREPTFTDAMKTEAGRRAYWRNYYEVRKDRIKQGLPTNQRQQKDSVEEVLLVSVYVDEEELPETCRVKCRIPCDYLSKECLLTPLEIVRLRPNLIAADARERLASTEPGKPSKKIGRKTLGERVVPENFWPKTKAKKGLMSKRPRAQPVT